MEITATKFLEASRSFKLCESRNGDYDSGYRQGAASMASHIAKVFGLMPDILKLQSTDA